jgi:uncharacterized membrane protein
MPQNFFSAEQKKEISRAIAEAERMTSGEIRVHVERRCNEDVMDHAAFIFEELKMHKTELRNGVLFYISYEDHKLAILGDAGINARVPKDFWTEIKEKMISEFKKGNYTVGLSEGIRMAGEQLSAHFPRLRDDKDELSNEISFGDS